MTTATEGWAATAFVDAHLPRFLDELVDYCRIPTWGGHDAGMARGAGWLRRKLESIGFAVEVVPLLARGILRPNVDSVFPLSEIGKAHQRLESNETFGKVVVVME